MGVCGGETGAVGVEREISIKKISLGQRDLSVSGGGWDAGGGKRDFGCKSRNTAAMLGLVCLW